MRSMLFQDSADRVGSQLDADKIGYWLEIKRVAQFLESGPNWHYERIFLELLPQDIYKLANDPKIFYASLLVIPFYEQCVDRQSGSTYVEISRHEPRMSDWNSSNL
jgi:hypothetical protein